MTPQLSTSTSTFAALLAAQPPGWSDHAARLDRQARHVARRGRCSSAMAVAIAELVIAATRPQR